MSAFTVLFDRVTNVIHTQLGISDEASEANVNKSKHIQPMQFGIQGPPAVQLLPRLSQSLD